MPAEPETVYSAAEIVHFIEELLSLQDLGDVSEGLSSAVMALDSTPCETLADAIAFISFSRRITQRIVAGLLYGDINSLEMAGGAARYMEIAMAFLREEDTRRQCLWLGNRTLH